MKMKNVPTEMHCTTVKAKILKVTIFTSKMSDKSNQVNTGARQLPCLNVYEMSILFFLIGYLYYIIQVSTATPQNAVTHFELLV